MHRERGGQLGEQTGSIVADDHDLQRAFAERALGHSDARLVAATGCDLLVHPDLIGGIREQVALRQLLEERLDLAPLRLR